jgi:hypothetical protein
MALEYVGDSNGYTVYRNSDGFLEGYKSIVPGKDKGVKHVFKGSIINAIDSKRAVTTVTTLEEFSAQIKIKRPRIKSYDPYKDPNQLQIK